MLGCGQVNVSSIDPCGKTFLNVTAVELKVRTDIGAFYRLELGKIGKPDSGMRTDSWTKVAPGFNAW